MKLEVKFKTEDIDTFYETFVDNMAKYEAEDALTVNSLFSFINFEKFKESILLYKKDRVDSGNQGEAFGSIGASDPQKMFDELMAEDTENGANGWVFKLDKEMKRGLKMKIWSKRLENGHDISKAVYNMPNIKMSQVESFINAFD